MSLLSLVFSESRRKDGRIEDGLDGVAQRPAAAQLHPSGASWSVPRSLNFSATRSPTRTGTGAAYCQVIDSIYGDVPLSRCKFNAK